ncbi:DUF262 domain-containing HNH endonuclease family protein [Corynebacterium sp. USCH3]|uniref:DUF262 domain-containing protein n=1 Tax=Corynebacterium sp. USCH3 TaxID=3024840 RepID=UPI0030A768AD
MAKFNPTDQTIESILTSGFFRIPRYQREYSWEKENIIDLWNDLRKAESGGLFLGHIVTQAQEPSTWDVIDGQQRLTTIAIALRVIEEEFRLYAEDGMADGVRQYIEGTSKVGKPIFRIQQWDSSNLVSIDILSKDPKEYLKKLTPSAADRKQQIAYENFRELIRSEISSRSKQSEIDVLEEIRERFLQAHAIVVEGANRASAFALFETLNDRGMSLTQMDLVKNEVISSIPETAEEASERAWMDAVRLFDSVPWKPAIDHEGFLYYFWNSTGYQDSDDIVKTERLRKTVAEWLDDPEHDRIERAQEFVESLCRTAQIFSEFTRTLEAPNGKHWTGLARSYGRSSTNSKWYEIDQALYGCLVPQSVLPLQLLFSVLRKHLGGKKSIMTQRLLVDFLRDISSFQFRWSVAQKSSTETVRRMYRRASFSVDQATSSGDIRNSLSRFREDADSLMATDVQFKDGLKKMTYFDKRPDAVHRVRYFFERLENYWGESRLPPGMEQMSIEHIEPQSGKALNAPNRQWIGKIGNLMLLPPKDNSDAAAGDFASKFEALDKFSNPNDEILREALGSGEWSNAYSNERMEHLLEIAVEIWPTRLSEGDDES